MEGMLASKDLQRFVLRIKNLNNAHVEIILLVFFLLLDLMDDCILIINLRRSVLIEEFIHVLLTHRALPMSEENSFVGLASELME